jgi:structural maintenance of chromosome 3 (chondroitin sulfate proteoglycan 6)
LAFIFAIQRCDPAPFYLFDEIDAALDERYRKEVANLIWKHSTQKIEPKEEKDTQFIIATFKPEMVEIGQKFFSVSIPRADTREKIKKISKVAEITEEEAKSILTSEAEIERQPPPSDQEQKSEEESEPMDED